MYLQTARALFKNWHSSRTSAIKPLDARWMVGAANFNPTNPEYSDKLLEVLQKHCDLLVDSTGKLTLRRASECSDFDISTPPNLARHVQPITQKPLAAWDAAGASPAENVDAADAAFPVPPAVWSRLDNLWIQAAHQHCIVVVAGNFMAGVRASAGAASTAVRDVLQRLITCYLSKHAMDSASGWLIVACLHPASTPSNSPSPRSPRACRLAPCLLCRRYLCAAQLKHPSARTRCSRSSRCL